MTYNPTKEVAVARDAAEALDAPICVVLWVTKDGEEFGMASYGATRELCASAKDIGEWCYKAAQNWGSVESGEAPF